MPVQARDSGLEPQVLLQLRPHLVNLNLGRFSSDGKWKTEAGDVDAMFGEHLAGALTRAKAGGEPLRLLFFAHGGLVKESAGLRIAHKHVEYWKRNRIYPIYFVWETGLFETLGQLLRRSQEGARGFVSGRITDPLIESTVRALQGARIWGGMKLAAERAVADPGSPYGEGGAHYVARKLLDFLAQNAGAQIELHAVGHSAGSIFHAHFLSTALGLGAPPFRSVHFLAPAIRVDLYKKRVAGLVGQGKGIDHLSLFTMRKDYERDDHCARIYRKSLLYLIHYALEREREVPILGLEQSLRADSALARHFGLGTTQSAHAEVIFSKSDARSGRSASHSVTHGGFDDDKPTMESIVRRVLRKADTDPVIEYVPERGMRAFDTWTDEVDWPEELQFARRADEESAHQSFEERRAAQPGGRNRKLALCIGIDDYPDAPLFGCVADAREWGSWLQSQGFKVSYVLNEQATARTILEGIESLLSRARAGDVVVIHYSGHGTQIADESGDEARGMDQAWVPRDYLDAEFVLDDRLGELYDQYEHKNIELVVFTDCCHSGTNTRVFFAPGSPELQPGSRFLPVSRELQRRFNDKYPDEISPTARNGLPGWEVHFAACQDNQSAYEEGGAGKFTTIALTALRKLQGTRGTYGRLADMIQEAFADDRRQRPSFRARADRRRRPLFAGGAVPHRTPDVETEAPEEQPSGATGDIQAIKQSLDALARRMDELSTLIRQNRA